MCIQFLPLCAHTDCHLIELRHDSGIILSFAMHTWPLILNNSIQEAYMFVDHYKTLCSVVWKLIFFFSIWKKWVSKI